MTTLRYPLLCLMLALLATPVFATSASRLDLDTLTDKADVIVHGKVTGRDARWDDARAGIWTHHQFEATETLKGEREASREILTRGGVVGNIGQHVAGSGNLEIDGEYVLFLWKDDQSRLRLLGMVQGAFRVVEEEGVKRVRNSYAGLTLIDEKTGAPADKSERLPMEFTLEDLCKRVRDRLNPPNEKTAEEADTKEGEANGSDDAREDDAQEDDAKEDEE